MLIIALIGLKKTGKTTTAENLIREFTSRGKVVGGIKFMPNSKFSLDVEGKDTWRQRRAGANFVISLSRREITFIGDKKEYAGLQDALNFVPEETDVLVCEGLNDDHPDIKKVLVVRDPEGLEETIRIRGINGKITAISGLISNSDWRHPHIPVLNTTCEKDLSELIDLLTEK